MTLTQLRLILWKDYLIRKRKPITIGGIIWACITLISLVIVRYNVEPDVYPTCQFKARALPSAGLLAHLQSFICTLNNECHTIDEYEKIPTYKYSRLNHYHTEFLPILKNNTIIEIIQHIPSLTKLVDTITYLIDDPEIHNIIRNGIKLQDLFENPLNVKNVLYKNLNQSSVDYADFLNSRIQFENILALILSKSNISCMSFLTKILYTENQNTRINISHIICNLDIKEIQKLGNVLFYELNFEKYLAIIENFLSKIMPNSGISDISEMFRSLLRLTRFSHYIPKELKLIKGILSLELFHTVDDIGFSYIDINLIRHFLTLFEDMFGGTETYKVITNALDITGNGFEFIEKYIKMRIDTINFSTKSKNGFIKENNINILLKDNGLFNEKQMLKKNYQQFVVGMIELAITSLSEENAENILYYFTLINDIVNITYDAISVNLNTEEIIYKVSMKHTKAIKNVVEFGPLILNNLLNSLIDVNQVQIFTKKVYHPGQMFCDSYKLQLFFKISNKEAEVLKHTLCNGIWKNYVEDIIESFNVNKISKTISKMTSLIVGKTLGKNIREQYVKPKEFVYSIFNFIKYVMDEIFSKDTKNDKCDWSILFNNTDYDSLIEIFHSKINSSNIALVTIDAALTREIISSNPILETFLTSKIIKIISIIKTFIRQLDEIPPYLIDSIKDNITKLFEIGLRTLNNPKKAKNIFTIDHQVYFCNLVEICNESRKICEDVIGDSSYIEFPSNKSTYHQLTKLICNITTVVKNKLNSNLENDEFLKTIISVIKNTTITKDSHINWTDFISTVQQLYIKIDKHFGFIFTIDKVKYKDEWTNIKKMYTELLNGSAYENETGIAIQLGFNVCLYIMEILDSKVFELEKYEIWMKLKDGFEFINSLTYIINNSLKFLRAGMQKNFYFKIEKFPLTSKYLSNITKEIPYLIRGIADFIALNNNSLEKITTIFHHENKWPCTEYGIGEMINLEKRALNAMKSIEALLCVNNTLLEEWTQPNVVEKKMLLFSNSSMNEIHTEELYLSFASNVNNLIDNMYEFNILLKTSNNDYFNETDLISSWKYAANIIDYENKNNSLTPNILKIIDVLLYTTKEDIPENLNISLPPEKIWKECLKCKLDENKTFHDCKLHYWFAAKQTLKYVAEGGQQMVTDLLEYFTEVTAHGSNFLQLIGFTKKTGLYILYDKLPDFIDVLLNSVLDHEFIKEVYQSIGRQFWDCKKILDSLKVPTSSELLTADITLIKPYICPSLIYWVSIPMNENVLLDLFSKSQYIFFSLPIANYTGTFMNLYSDIALLRNKINVFKSNNATYSLFDKNWLKKFDHVFRLSKNNINIHTTDTFYFKNGMNMIYLTEITRLINDLLEKAYKLNETLSEENFQNKQNLKLFIKLLEKRPTEVIETIIFAITEEIKDRNRINDFELVNSFDRICTNQTYLIPENMWMKTNLRMVKQICKTDYRKYLGLPDKKIDIFPKFREIIYDINNLIYPIEALKNHSNEFWKKTYYNLIGYNGNQAGVSLKIIVKYASELGLKTFLSYLDINLQYYNVLLSYVTGENWWEDLRKLHISNYINTTMNVLEKFPEIIDHLVTNMADINVVRLLRDIIINDTNTFCKLSLSEYIPDNINLLSNYKESLCELNKRILIPNISPLNYSVQSHLEVVNFNKINTVVNDEHIINVKSKLLFYIKHGPREITLPMWVKRSNEFFNKNETSQGSSLILKKNFVFFLLNNVVDMLTLFNNDSFSSMPSFLTPIIKQISLQMIKQDEYTSFLCEMNTMNLTEIYLVLTETFHWDLMFTEIFSGRNYTWIEMNKSLRQLLRHLQYYFEDFKNANKEKLKYCLIKTSNSKVIDEIALHLMLGSHVMKLIKSCIPYFKNNYSFLKNQNILHLSTIMIKALPVVMPLQNILSDENNLKQEIKFISPHIKEYEIDQLMSVKIDLNKMYKHQNDDPHIMLLKSIVQKNSSDIASKHMNLIIKYVNYKYINENVSNLALNEFWSCEWLSKIVTTVEKGLLHSSYILQSLGELQWENFTAVNVESIIDISFQLMQNEYIRRIITNFCDLLNDFKPLMKNLTINQDLLIVLKGINTFSDSYNNFFTKSDLKFKLSDVFYDWDYIKSSISNHTSLDMAVLNEIENSVFDLTLLFKLENKTFRLKYYICDVENFSKIFISNTSFINAKNNQMRVKHVSSAICNINNTEIKYIFKTMFTRLNFTTIIKSVLNYTFQQIISLTGVSNEESEGIFSSLSETITLLPFFRGFINNTTYAIKKEPLIQLFQNSTNISNLLSKPEFLQNIGNMFCGKPFKTNISRYYRVIAQIADNVMKSDVTQLESLPNDYCRSLYKEIRNMGGGKILWTYIKPLLRGKILFTPNTTDTLSIISYVNETFTVLGKFISFVHKLPVMFTSIENIVHHNASLVTMQHLFTAPSVQNYLLKTFSVGKVNGIVSLNVSEILKQFDIFRDMKNLIMKISNMTSCISLDRFLAVYDEDQLERTALKLMKVNEFMAGIVFLNTNGNYEYKIRMDIDSVPSTSKIKPRFWMPGPNSDFTEHLRYFRGFVQLQDIIDKAIILLNKPENYQSLDNKNMTKHSTFDWGLYTQQMPYPCYVRDEFKAVLHESQALIIAFYFSLILVVASISRHLIWERESGNTNLMCIMGMNQNSHTLSWFIISLVEIFMVMAAMSLILRVGNILPTSNVFIIFVILMNYGISIIMFSYMVTSLFKSASLGAVSAAIFYLVCFLPYVLVVALESVLSFPQKLLTSLFMSSGFSYTLLIIARLEVQNVGLHWNNIDVSPLQNDSITVVNTFAIVLFDSFLYGIIGWTINNIRFRQNINLDSIKNAPDLKTTNIGVRICNITKTYKIGKSCKALDNVSVDLFKGQITTLLGHNGAGKTTLIGILMGIIKPDSGKISINQLCEDKFQPSVEKKIITNHIGLCPQSDVLIDSMTSEEHLIYYAQLKTGKTFHQVKYDVESMIKSIGLGKLSTEPVQKLSGGLRRRLCVGLAFIANPHLIVLDEPSSGVDPVARRDIWSLIISLKKHRTILLTTHHLDEAELLSDELVIMHKGKVLTSGSPLALKNKYGDGYKLSVTYNSQLNILKESKKLDITCPMSMSNMTNRINFDKPKCDTSNIVKDLLDLVKESIPNAVLKNIDNNSIIINLPFLENDDRQNNFTNILQQLEDAKTLLKYTVFSIDCSSLEHVFLKICKTVEKQNINDNKKQSIDNTCQMANNSNSDVDKNKSHQDLCNVESKNEKLYGSLAQQLLALLHKRFLHYHRNYRLLILQLILPAIFVALAMGFSLIRPPPDSENPIKLSQSLYNENSIEFVSVPRNHNISKDDIFFSLMNETIEEKNRKIDFWTKSFRDCKCVNNRQYCTNKAEFLKNNSVFPENRFMVFSSEKRVLEWIVETTDIYTEKRYGGWSLPCINKPDLYHFLDNKTNFIVWYNNKGDHALPSYVNTINNAILKKNSHKKVSIVTYNHPLKLSAEQLSKSSLLQHVADVGIAVVLLIGFSLVPAGNCIYLVNERTTQEKRLQLLCGVSPFTYWISTLIWDILVIILATIISVIILEIFALPIFVARENLPAICFLLILYGFSCSSLIHILEKFFNDASLANMLIFCINVFVGVTGLTILLILDVLSKSDFVDNIRWILHKIFLIIPQFVLGDGLVEISKNTIQASILSRFGMDTYRSPLGWQLIGPHYLSLVSTAILFFLINLAYEYHLLDKIVLKLQKLNPSKEDMDMEDFDVATERYRIEVCEMKSNYNKEVQMDDQFRDNLDKINSSIKLDKLDFLQVLSLKKKYRGIATERTAVENLTFGVKSGQCFGLLGVNGAGKSTTFKILTGEIMPTDGKIFINGKMVSQTELCNGSIAYCPQSDALDCLLTVEEHLNFYCKLRGLKNQTKIIKEILNKFELIKYTHQKTYTLSGGNKRKLCTAISLMGNSPIVLLDEPTSGMDPDARHNVNVAIKRAIHSGRCVLLSSHSLMECEDMCQVVAVMSLGRFVAFGPPNYLKQRYGDGYIISVRIASAEQKDQLIQYISEIFPYAQMQSSHYCTTQFLVPITCTINKNEATSGNILELKTNYVNTRLSDIFKCLECLRSKFDIIDCSINQSSLDQVFINFSNKKKKEKNNIKDNNGQIRLCTLEGHYNWDNNQHPNLQKSEIYITKL